MNWEKIFKGTILEELCKIIENEKFIESPICPKKNDQQVKELNILEKALFSLMQIKLDRVEKLTERLELILKKKININPNEEKITREKIYETTESLSIIKAMLNQSVRMSCKEAVRQSKENDYLIVIKKPHKVMLEKKKEAEPDFILNHFDTSGMKPQ